MDDSELQQRIKMFPRWQYEFDLRGHRTPVFYEGYLNRHRQRRRYFFDPLVAHLGGSLAGKRVLDLGCNAGFWSLAAIEAGASFVLGVEGRGEHLDQAELVFEVKQVDPKRYRFIEGDVFDTDLAELGSFDVVFCLGFLYHISKPVELLERISAVSSDILVVDTGLSSMAGAFLEIRRDHLDDPRSAIDRALVLHPTKKAMHQLLQEFGYAVAMLMPQFSDYTGCLDYRQGWRRAFIAARKTPLAGLPASIDKGGLGALLRDTWYWGTRGYAAWMRMRRAAAENRRS